MVALIAVMYLLKSQMVMSCVIFMSLPLFKPALVEKTQLLLLIFQPTSNESFLLIA